MCKATQTGCRADLHELARGSKEVSGSLVQISRGADVVDCELEDLALGCKRLDDVGGLVVNDLVGAQALAELDVAGRAGGGNMTTQRFRNLNTVDSSAA